ncbi:MAG: phosphoadenosine phosphosulfate reductase family protein [Verrucomicrobiaceae bacterium]|nr:phosphoadenosine phosphosulfate reductase family protein [Verrucomicrobiaceae bacterium]
MSPEAVSALNDEVQGRSAAELVRWAVARSEGKAVVTSNFRPYEAVILHLATEAQADIPVLWVDHGTNLPETYRFAEKCREKLGLNLKPYLPLMTSAHWLALNGGAIPMPDQVELVESFSRVMKLEPFERGMRELAPSVWITALRKEQNPQRAATLQPVMWDAKFNCLKVNPILDWTPAEMDPYLEEHGLPNERTYYDPAKGDEKHECGLHAKLTTEKDGSGI